MSPIHKLMQAVSVIRSFDPEMPTQTLQALLFIHEHPGVHQHTMIEKLGFSTSQGARLAARLGEWERRGKPGKKLVFAETDDGDRRWRKLWLTPRGQSMMTKLIDCLQ